MYDNIGQKIKTLATWIFIAEAIGCIITGVILSKEEAVFLLICLFGPIVAWVSSWILYAFGEMVEDVHAIRNSISPNSAEDAAKEATRKAQEKVAIEKAEREAKEKEKQANIAKAMQSMEEAESRETLRSSFNTLTPMEKPLNFIPNNDWSIKELSTKVVFERYLAKDEWSESYRYVCYLELKNRLG